MNVKVLLCAYESSTKPGNSNDNELCETQQTKIFKKSGTYRFDARFEPRSFCGVEEGFLLGCWVAGPVEDADSATNEETRISSHRREQRIE